MELKDIVNQTETSKAMFQFLSLRKRFRRETNIPYFQTVLENNGVKVVSQDLMKTFKSLSSKGYGSIRGNKFLWHYDLKDIAKVAAGKMKLEDAKVLKLMQTNKTSNASTSVIITRAALIKAVELLVSGQL